MTYPFHMLFDTAIGRCGIAWGDDGILAVSFPEADDARTRQRLLRRAPNAAETNAPPGAIRQVIEGIRALAFGRAARFDDAELDLTGVPPFDRSVYGLTRAIGPGEMRTYGELASDLGDVALSRKVGQSLGSNPFPIVVPCHRVENQRVCRADQPRAVGHAVGDLHHLFLVGHGNIEADKAELWQKVQCFGQLVLWHVDGHVMTAQTMRLQPVREQTRRPGMGHWGPDDGGKRDACEAHAAMVPLFVR